MARRRTTRDIHELYEQGTPITMVTCYDYTFARLVEIAQMDTILVGDSLGNVIQGRATTLAVSVDDVIYHTRAVMRGNRTAHVVADLPFGAYQVSVERAMQNAVRLMKEGGAQAVKLEGGEPVLRVVERLSKAGIPVCGHLGLTPQSVHQIGGYRVQGREEQAAEQLVKDAQALENAGAYMVVLEMVPREVARAVTESIGVPTIGIGAGPETSGQVLVLQDLLGMNRSFSPKFLKRYADLEGTVVDALESYGRDVREGSFPEAKHSY